MTPDPNSHRDHSTLEVCLEAENYPEPYTQRHENAPQLACDDVLPERAHDHGYEKPHGRRIRSPRRRKFFMFLGFAALIIIGAAVGGGVGGSLSVRSSSSTSSTNDSTTSSSNSPSSPSADILLSTSKLASMNYTDEAGIDYHLVYYQLSSKAICQSMWNASNQTWTTSIVSNDTANIMSNTPISVDLWRTSDEKRQIDVFWLEPNGFIRGLSGGPRQWGNGGINQKYYANGIASYAKECATCFANNVVMSYGSDQILEFAITMPAWQQTPLSTTFPSPVNGSDLSLKPVYTISGNGYMVLHMNPAKGGNLVQLFWNGRAWDSSEVLPTELSRNASIASFTAGFNITNAPTYTIQVLTTDGKDPSSHVTVTSYDSRVGKWTSTRDMSGFEDILDGSALAASQAGRVYGLVAGTDGGTTIAEWSWNSEDGSFTRVGNVTILQN